MAKPKGNKKEVHVIGKIDRRPRQKGKIKNRPQEDYIARIAAMSEAIKQAEEAEKKRLLAQGCSETVAANLANRAGWAKRNELLISR